MRTLAVPAGLGKERTHPQSSSITFLGSMEGLSPKSGPYGGAKMHGYGTNLEGEWADVMRAIEDCHAAVHALGCQRIATDIRVGTRLDKQATNEDKVAAVERLLAASSGNSGS